MKKTWILTTLLALLLLGASAPSPKLVRLTIVNKTGLPLEIKLTGECEDNFYYLRIPEGDRVFPAQETFTITPDIYKMQPYYIELWDPVYGYSCGDAGSKTLYASRNIQVTFLECDVTPRHRGEPSILKWPGLRYIY
jgi:hypothetical protein